MNQQKYTEIKKDISKGMDALKNKFVEDPMTVILGCSLAAGALAKLINSLSAAQGRRAYAKQDNYSIKHRRR